MSLEISQQQTLQEDNPPGNCVDDNETLKKARVKRRQQDLLCKGQRVRIYPTPDQEFLLTRWIGCGRYLWNWALNLQQEHYKAHSKHIGTGVFSKDLTALRKIPEMAWLDNVPRTVLTYTFKHLDTSWKSFFDGMAGKRLDSPGKPTFRRRGGRRESASFQCDHRHDVPWRMLETTTAPTHITIPSQQESDQNKHALLDAFPQDISGTDISKSENQSLSKSATACLAGGRGLGEIRIPGLGWVDAVFSEEVFGEVSSITVKQEGLAWYASFTLINVEEADIQRNTDKKVHFDFPDDNPTCLSANPLREGLASLDASVKHGAVASSNGKDTYSIFSEALKKRAKKAEEKRARYQRRMAFKHDCAMIKAGYSRNVDGTWPKRDYKTHPKSKREEKLGKLCAGISLHQLFRKRDAIHKFTTDLVMKHHTIVVETLILKAMATSLSRGFRRAMHEACMGEIIRQLKYKCEWHNRTLIFVSQWFPSSKRCSNVKCHTKNAELTLNDRMWTCPTCGTHHERDDNAAFNLWQEGWRLLENYFQKNDTACLAAGSVVRGSKGVLFEVKKERKPRKERLVSPEQLQVPGLIT